MPQLSLASGGRRVLALVVGLGILTGSAVGLLRWLQASQARTVWDRASLERAARLESDNAFYHHRLGQWEQFSLVEGDLPRALLHYRRATELNPYESEYWLDLAEALLLSDGTAEAEAAVAQAVQVDPRTPHTLWRVGNFWLRAGQPTRAFAYFRQVLVAEPPMTPLVVQVCHRALGDPEILLREVLPPQPPFLLDYLRYLVWAGESVAAARVWEELVALAQAFEPQQVLFFLDYLIRTRQLPQAMKVWSDLKILRLLPAENLASGELLYNPALRAPILNGGFDWRVERNPHVSVRLGAGRQGEQPPAVVIRFSGEENLHYRNFYQYVVVEPRRRYRFQAWLSTDGITTESGPRLEMADPYDLQAEVAYSPGLVGTNDWTPQQVEFVTGPETRLLRVGIARLPSRRLTNQIRGTVRAAEFRLQAVRPGS